MPSCLPEDVTGKQLGNRFNHAFKDKEVIHSEVVSKAGKKFGFVVYPLNTNISHGEQYLEKQNMLKQCQKIYNNTSWRGSRITIAEGRDHYRFRLKREKIEANNEAKIKVNAKKILKTNLSEPLPSTDDDLSIKSRWGNGYVNVSRNPMPWNYRGKELVSRHRTYNSDSDVDYSDTEASLNPTENNTLSTENKEEEADEEVQDADSNENKELVLTNIHL